MSRSLVFAIATAVMRLTLDRDRCAAASRSKPPAGREAYAACMRAPEYRG